MSVSGAAQGASGAAGPTLEWIAPAACPDSATLQRTLAATLALPVDAGQPNATATDPPAPGLAPPSERAPAEPNPLRAHALVRRRTEGGWVLDLQLERGESRRTRRIEAETCEGLASATVLVVAIAFDPLRPLPRAVQLIGSPESSVPEAPVAAAQPAGPSVPTTPPPPRESTLAPGSEGAGDKQPARATPSARRFSPVFSLRATGGAGLRVLPGARGVFELSGGLSGRSWRAELGADVWVPARSDVGAGLQARFGLSAARVRGCGVPRIDPVSFPVCASLEAGAQTGRGVNGFSTTKRAIQPWLAARTGAFVAWRIHPRLSLWAGGEAVFALLAPGFGTDEADDLVAAPAVGAVVTAGVEVHFGQPKD